MLLRKPGVRKACWEPTKWPLRQLLAFTKAVYQIKASLQTKNSCLGTCYPDNRAISQTNQQQQQLVAKDPFCSLQPAGYLFSFSQIQDSFSCSWRSTVRSSQIPVTIKIILSSTFYKHNSLHEHMQRSTRGQQRNDEAAYPSYAASSCAPHVQSSISSTE